MRSSGRSSWRRWCAAVLVDVQSNNSYFKFNLDYMSFYNLVRLQDNGDNRGAYMTVRTTRRRTRTPSST